MLKEVEEKIHSFLKEKTSSQDYENWFSHLKITNISDNNIEISVPNDMIKDFIEDKLSYVLQDAIYSILKNQLLIIINSENKVEKIPEEMNLYKNISDYEVDESNLVKIYTFDNFVVGKSNQFAHAAAFSVAQNPGDQYNPLFIYGASGLGKTHLIQAIGHYIKQRNANARVLYLRTQMFINMVYDSVSKKEVAKLRNTIGKMDVLLLDDIHFIKKSDFLQDELFNTFNLFHENKKQIVLTSDRLPREIPHIPDRLVSRFQMGLIVDIKEPDFDTRLAILRKKTEIQKLKISDEILNYIANNIKGNVRQLEGAIITLFAHAALSKRPIDIKLAREAVLSLIEPSSQYDEINIKITSDEIINVILGFYKLTPEELFGKKRKTSIVIPRQICVYLLRKYTDLSLKEIALKTKRKDHSTIIHAVKKIEQLQKNNEKIREDIVRINSLLGVD